MSMSGARQSRRPHATSRGRKAPHGMRASPRQTTLTQIDFVTRIISSDDDLDIIEVTPHPKKKRRLSPIASSVIPRSWGRRRKTSELDSALSQQKNHTPSKKSQEDLTAGVPSPTSTSRLNIDDHSLQPPKTPSRQRRTIVPSSQSPEATPLSIRTNERGRAEKAALAHVKASNRSSPSKEAQRRIRGRPRNRSHIVKPYLTRDARELTLPEDEKNEESEGLQVSPLHFSPSRDRLRLQEAWPKGLQTSPNAPGFALSGFLPADKPSMGPPPPKNRTEIPPSQATTMDLTQFSNSAPAYKFLVPSGKRGLVPSSQMTTQDPTQFSDSQRLPMPRTQLRRTSSGANKVKSEPGVSSTDRADPSNIPSSQAETVLPSSVLDEHPSWAAKPDTGTQYLEDLDLATDRKASGLSGGVKVKKEGAAKASKKGQSRPKDCVTRERPLPSYPSSQDSLESIKGDVDNMTDKVGSPLVSPKRSVKQEQRDDEGYLSSEDELQIVRERCKNPNLRQAQKRKVKDEPLD